MAKYEDDKGYIREDQHSNAWHRKVAYHKIYKKNRDKYPLPFSKYEVHHKDGNKKNNNPENLEILTPEEHIDAHIKLEKEKRKEKGEILASSYTEGVDFLEIVSIVGIVIGAFWGIGFGSETGWFILIVSIFSLVILSKRSDKRLKEIRQNIRKAHS